MVLRWTQKWSARKEDIDAPFDRGRWKKNDHILKKRPRSGEDGPLSGMLWFLGGGILLALIVALVLHRPLLYLIPLGAISLRYFLYWFTDSEFTTELDLERCFLNHDSGEIPIAEVLAIATFRKRDTSMRGGHNLATFWVWYCAGGGYLKG